MIGIIEAIELIESHTVDPGTKLCTLRTDVKATLAADIVSAVNAAYLRGQNDAAIHHNTVTKC